jgi:hypothetical protein
LKGTVKCSLFALNAALFAVKIGFEKVIELVDVDSVFVAPVLCPKCGYNLFKCSVKAGIVTHVCVYCGQEKEIA